MPAQPAPVIFTITEAGKVAALEGENAGLTINLTELAYGTGQYTPTGNETQLSDEVGRASVAAGDVDIQTNTLRFSSTVYVDNRLDIYELGLFTDNNELFAVASFTTPEPILPAYPGIAYVASFELALNDVDASTINISTNPDGAMASAMMTAHVNAVDPHPKITQQINLLMQQIENMRIKIGEFFCTSHHYENSEEVAARLGYGEWARYAEGRTLVGYSEQASDPDSYKAMDNKFGENEHGLTIAELPPHSHPIRADSGSDGSNFHLSGRLSAPREHVDDVIGSTGDNNPHNNIQPSVVVAYWIRTA